MTREGTQLWGKQPRRRPSWSFQKDASTVLHSSEADTKGGLRVYACSSPLVRIFVQRDSQPGSVAQGDVAFTVATLAVSSCLLWFRNCLLNNAYKMCRHGTGTCRSCAKGTQRRDHDCSNAPTARSMCEPPRLVLASLT